MLDEWKEFALWMLIGISADEGAALGFRMQATFASGGLMSPPSHFSLENPCPPLQPSCLTLPGEL